MNKLSRALALAGSLFALSCGNSIAASDSGTISGVIMLTGATDASGVLVSAGTSGAVTAADGSYTLRGVAEGENDITAVAASTLEGTETTSVTLTTNGGHAIAPTLTFTALGGIKGLVDLGGGATGNGGATIVVDGSAVSAVSEASGAFAISGVTAGAHSLIVSAPGFVSATPAVTVLYGAVADASTLTLSPSFADGTLSGIVTVSGAAQLSGLAVVLSGPTVGATLTDSSGNYSFVALADGIYSVSATVESTLQETLITRVQVQSGQGIASTFVFTGLGNVSGSAVLDGQTSGNGGIALSLADGVAALTNDAGNYELKNIPAGNATLTASFDGYSPGTAQVVIPWNGTANASAISLLPIAVSPPAPGSLSGSVSISGASDLSGVSIAVSGPGSAETTTASDGTFAFDDLPPGFYVLTATASSTLEGTRTASVSISSGNNTAATALDFTGTGQLEGTVTLDGSSTGNAGIIVTFDASSAAATTDDAGHFTLQSEIGSGLLHASFEGYQPATSAQLSVSYGQTTDVAELDLAPL